MFVRQIGNKRNMKHCSVFEAIQLNCFQGIKVLFVKGVNGKRHAKCALSLLDIVLVIVVVFIGGWKLG